MQPFVVIVSRFSAPGDLSDGTAEHSRLPNRTVWRLPRGPTVCHTKRRDNASERTDRWAPDLASLPALQPATHGPEDNFLWNAQYAMPCDHVRTG